MRLRSETFFRYKTIGSQKLSFGNVSFSCFGNEIVYPRKYFSYELYIDSIPIFTISYVLHSITYDLVLGTDVINKLNLAINEDGHQIAGKHNNLRRLD